MTHQDRVELYKSIFPNITTEQAEAMANGKEEAEAGRKLFCQKLLEKKENQRLAEIEKQKIVSKKQKR